MFTDGNAVGLLRNGVEYFPAIIAAMEHARASIYLETYIFADDVSGRAVATALTRAAARGLDVRVVVDGFGTKPYFSESLASALVDGGVRLVRYREDVVAMNWNRGRLRRLHRKLVIVDGAIAFVGGINIIDDHNTPGQTPPRIDFAVCVKGPLLEPIIAAANRLWLVLRVMTISDASLPALNLSAVTESCGQVKAKFVLRDNLGFRRQIENAYLAALRIDRKSTRLNSSHRNTSRMPSSA